jgi:DNA-binding Lrp family transcriptional regulator
MGGHLVTSELVSESDLELIDAIQINPRASWRDVGTALDVSAMTAARRWSSLREAGLAWSNVTTGPQLSRGVIIELACAPGTTDQVVRGLVATPDVMTVGHLTGEYNLYALTVSVSVKALANFQLDVINKLPAMRLRTHLYHHAYGGSGRWRLNVLNRSQVSRLSESKSPPSPWSPVSITDRKLFLALAEDARRPLTKLAEDLDLTPQAVGRQLKRAQRSGTIDFRVDVARPYAGWHLGAFLWISTPQEQLHIASEKLGKLPETRFCASISGTARNISLIVSLHAPEDVDSLIRRIEAEDPPMQVVDCQFSPRLEKVDGRLLDEGGRAVGFVPLDPWASEAREGASPR